MKSPADPLDKARRLEAMGVLTRSVTPDLNNHMAAILSLAELVLESMAPEHPLREELEEIMRAGTRAAVRTRELDRLARQLSPIGHAA
jgi:hypothetical protein